MPEWIMPAEAFYMILRAKHPANPGLADQITSAVWFYYPKMQTEKHSAADVEAAKNALDLLVKSFRDGRIAGRGILQAGHAAIDIDPTDKRIGILSVWQRELDCSLVVPGRKFVNVFLKETDIRPLCVKRGRPQEYDWQAIKAKAFALMDHHGNFRPDDPEWNAQARLEEQLADFCQAEYGHAPEASSLREKLPAWLKEWREQKSQGISALSENQ
jgi:hypothetical protein